MRPASRSGPGMRPGTSQQQPVPGGMRPGTGSQGAARMGTAQRMGTAAGGGGAFFGGGTDVSIADRPVTQQGMMGVRQATAGPGRQVQDASYFVGLLRSKTTEISAEIGRMRGELERSAKDATVSAQLERKYDGLIKEVRGLEGDLADYNLALDKSRTGVEAADISAYYTALKRRNEGTSREVDGVFMERQERERGAHRLEEQTAELQRVAESRVASLPPSSIAEYRALVEESAGLTEEVGAMQRELEAVNARVEAAEADLKRDRVRDEYAIVEKRITLLKRERATLEDEMAATRLDPGEAREKLLTRVKEDNARLQVLDRTLKALEEENAGRRKAMTELASEVEERRGEAGDQSKYEALFKRDQEMTEFIDRFGEVKEKELMEQRRSQNTVVALLEHISEGIERERSMPDRAAADEMKEDLSDKNRELKVSQMTAERLGDELALRQAELDKISSLDAKIAVELRSLAERMETMQVEMGRFADIAGLKVAAEEGRATLETRIAEYARRRDLLRQQVHLLSSETEAKKSALARDPQAAAIDAVESKLKTYEQTVFTLREFIATKGRETDYEATRDEVLRALAELNVFIQKAQVLATGGAGGGVIGLAGSMRL